ncbi:MAG: hypothetical protein ACREGR_03875 [Minisyncoccia bacterium]
MNVWIRFFIGTPRRFLATCGGLIVIFGLIAPQAMGEAVRALLVALAQAVAPFIQPLLTLGIIFIGLGFALRGVWKRGSKK